MSEVRVYGAPSDLAGRWVRETDMTALRAENQRLKEALEQIAKWDKRSQSKTAQSFAKAALQPERGRND